MQDQENIVAPSIEATSQEPSTPTPALESSNVGQQVDSQEGDTNWKEKYQNSSSEARRLKEEAEEARREAEEARRELLGVATTSREVYEKWIDSKGLTPKDKEYYMNVYDTQLAPAATEPKPDAPAPSQPLVVQPPVNPVREAWMQRRDREEATRLSTQREATENFFSRDENQELPEVVKDSIRITAAMLDQEYGYSPKEALDMARKRVLDPELTRDEGYVQGVRDSLQGGVSRGVSGASARSNESPRLPKADEAFVQFEIQRKGLAGDAAEKFRTQYAQRLAQKK
jgi:hypothetical protein